MKSMIQGVAPMSGDRQKPAAKRRATALYRIVDTTRGATGGMAAWRAALRLSERGPFTSRDLAAEAGLDQYTAMERIGTWVTSGRAERVNAPPDDGISDGRARGWRGARFAVASSEPPPNQHGSAWEKALRVQADVGFFLATDLLRDRKFGAGHAARVAIMEWVASGHVVRVADQDRSRKGIGK